MIRVALVVAGLVVALPSPGEALFAVKAQGSVLRR